MELPPDADGNASFGSAMPDKLDLIVYTLRVRAPASWDDMKAESITMSLNEAMESALQAVLGYINDLHPDIEMVVEQ